MWEKINQTVHSHSVLSAFIFSALFAFAVLIVARFTGILQVPIATESWVFFNIGRIVLAIIIILLMQKLQVFDINDFKTKGLGKGILLGWILPVGMLITFILRLPENAAFTSDISLIFVVILDSFFGTGLFEEVLFRGLVLLILLKKMGDTKKGVIAAVLISSAFFASAHLINLFDESLRGTLAAVIPQIIRTFAQGLFFAAVFLRSKTLLAPIFLHGLGRVAGGVFSFGVIYSTEALLLQEAAGDPSFLPILLNTALSTLPFLIAGLILIRNAEPAGVALEKS